MFVSLTRAKTSDQPIGNATIVAGEMVRWLREIEGFEGMVMLSREGSSVGMTFWQSRAIAERHKAARMQFIDRMLSVADVELEEILEYEVTFADVPELRVGFSY
jgi:hypothetical protein